MNLKECGSTRSANEGKKKDSVGKGDDLRLKRRAGNGGDKTAGRSKSCTGQQPQLPVQFSHQILSLIDFSASCVISLRAHSTRSYIISHTRHVACTIQYQFEYSM